MTVIRPPLFVGDFGQTISIQFVDENNCVEDLTGSDLLELWFVRPGGDCENPVVKTATFKNLDATTGILEYVIEADFIDSDGTWRVRGRAVETGVLERKTGWQDFEVEI